MAVKRTFGWVQNLGDLKKLKKVVSVFNSNSKENRWMVEKRLPLLLHYNLISQVDYTLFIDELNSALIEVDYSTLKGRGAGSDSRAIKEAIKALEQESIIDKIRAEIADLDDADYDYEGYYKATTDALKIIDKYKADMESKE